MVANWRRGWAGLLSLGLLAGFLAVVEFAPDVATATAAASPSAHMTASDTRLAMRGAAKGKLKASPSAGISGEALMFTGKVPPKHKRKVILQRRAGHRWVKVASGKTNKKGRFSLSTRFRPSTTKYRVHAKAAKIGKRRYGATSTSTVRVSTQPQSGVLALAGSAQQDAAVTATATFKPVRKGRRVTLQRKVGNRWAEVAAGAEATNGSVSLVVPTDSAGSFTFRAVASASGGAASIATPTKSITVRAAPSVDTTPPPVPAGLDATAGDGSVHLSWSAVSADDLVGYHVYRATSADGPWTKVTSSPITATSRDVAGLTDGTKYWFAVTSVDTTGNESAKSDSATATPAAPSDTTPPPVPTDLDATAGDGSVHLSWSAVSAGDLAGYNVYQATSADGPWVKVTSSPIMATSRDVTGLTDGAKYWFAVASVDTTDNESARSDSASATPTAPSDTTPPPVPTGLDATAGDGSVHLSWSAVSADDLAGYNVYRSASAEGPWTKVTSSPIPDTSRDVTGLTNGTTYWFAVTAIDAEQNESGTSTAATATPTAAPPAVVSHCGTISANETWSSASIHRLTCSVTVPSGVTLTIEPGAVVKANTGSVSLSVSGSLVAVGTAADPVVLTSINDDSVGGDTGGDGSASSPAAGDWPGIEAQGADSVVDVDHAVIKYADRGIDASSGSLSVINSTITKSGGYGILASGTSGVPVIMDNTITDTASYEAVHISDTDVDLAKLDGNDGSGNGGNGIYLTRVTQTVDGTLPWSGTLAPVIANTCGSPCGLTVPAGVTLTLDPGTVIKTVSSNSSGLLVKGSLKAVGTAADPVVLTSINDDSVGGDTGGDGSASSPAAGDWPGISVGSGGFFDLEGTKIRYATTALSVADDAGGTFHGSVVTSSFGVAGGDGFVDATGVDWGSASGPAPIGSGIGYSGSGVLVAEWVGWVQPPPPATTPAYEPPSLPFRYCRDIAFIGARGSGEDPQGDPEPDFDPDHPEEGLGTRTPDVYQGLVDEFAAHSWFGITSDDIKQMGVQYRALGVLSDPLRFIYGGDYLDSIYDGVNKTIAMVDFEEANCPGEKIVLAGYSQGALAIHIALRKMTSSELGNIIGVALISDPAKVSHGSEYTLEEFDKEAGSGVSNAEGVWSKFWSGSDVGALPSAIVDRTISICRNHDIVCAPPATLNQNLVYDSALHTDDYYKTKTDVLGRWIADRYMGQPFTLDP